MPAKGCLSDLHYGPFYAKLIRPKLADFLCDERKRQDQETSMMPNVDSQDSNIA